MFQRLWNDETGAVLSAELVLIGTVAVLAAVVGLAALAEGVVTELADLGGAIGSLNQSFQAGGILGHHAFIGSSFFQDQHDFCDVVDGDFSNSRCLVICVGNDECGNPVVFNGGNGPQ